MKKYFRNYTIRTPSKRWKDELDKLSNEELIDGIKNFKIKKKGGIRKKLLDLERRRNLKEKEKYGSEEDEEEQEKARKLVNISEKFFNDYEEQQKLNPFFDSDDDDVYSFGKKQKRDIKGMVKKILLYGGLPTLLVVSLGVLSNKKINTGKVKKNIKVKANVQEKIFKKDFVSKLKEYYKTKRGEIKKMDKDVLENMADTRKRKERRNKQPSSPFDELIKSSNSQQSSKTPEKTPLELIKERRQQGMSSDKIYINIDSKERNWSYVNENQANYYINKNDKNIYNKTKNNISMKYVYDNEKGNIGLLRGGEVYKNDKNIYNN